MHKQLEGCTKTGCRLHWGHVCGLLTREAHSPWLGTSGRGGGSVGRALVVGVGVVAGLEDGVPGTNSTPSKALGPASSCSAGLDLGGLPSTLGCSSQEVLLRLLSAERRPQATPQQHVLCPRPLPGPTGLPTAGPWGSGRGGPGKWKAAKWALWSANQL